MKEYKRIAIIALIFGIACLLFIFSLLYPLIKEDPIGFAISFGFSFLFMASIWILDIYLFKKKNIHLSDFLNNLSRIFFQKLIKIGIIPILSETSVFLVSLTVLLAFIVNISSIININFPEFIKNILTNKDSYRSEHDVDPVDIIITLIWGFFLSIYHPFSKRQKTDEEKSRMLVYVFIVSYFVGFIAFLYAIPGLSMGFKGIFIFTITFINLISALLLGAASYKMGSAFFISDEDAKGSDIIIGSIVVILIFLYSNYILKNSWPITFSMCLVYSLNVHRFVNNITTKIANYLRIRNKNSFV